MYPYSSYFDVFIFTINYTFSVLLAHEKNCLLQVDNFLVAIYQNQKSTMKYTVSNILRSKIHFKKLLV